MITAARTRSGAERRSFERGAPCQRDNANVRGQGHWHGTVHTVTAPTRDVPGVVPPSAPPVLTPPHFGSKHAARRSRRGAPRQPAHVQPQAVEAAGGAGSGGVCVLSASGAGCERGGSRPPARTLSARRAAGEAQAGPRAPAPLRTESGACDQADTARTFFARTGTRRMGNSTIDPDR